MRDYKRKPAWRILLERLYGKVSDLRPSIVPDEPRPKKKVLRLSKETLRNIGIQYGAERNAWEILHGRLDRAEKQGLNLAESHGSCVGLSACPNCPYNVDQAMREDTDFCPYRRPVTQDDICSLADVCREDPFSGDPYGDLCITGRAGGTGGDLGGC